MKKASLLLMAFMAVIIGLNCDKQPETLAEAKMLAAQSGRPILIDFYTEW